MVRAKPREREIQTAVLAAARGRRRRRRRRSCDGRFSCTNGSLYEALWLTGMSGCPVDLICSSLDSADLSAGPGRVPSCRSKNITTSGTKVGSLMFVQGLVRPDRS